MQMTAIRRIHGSLIQVAATTFVDTVKLGNNTSLAMTGKGNVRLLVDGMVQRITGVFYVPELKNNLLSIGQLQEKGLAILFQHDRCKVYHSEKGLIMDMKMAPHRMFKLHVVTAPSTCFSTITEAKAQLWHCRYGHLSYNGLKTLQQKNMVNGLPELGSSLAICKDWVSEESKAYRLYDPNSKKIIISRDVVFEEDKAWDWDQKCENAGVCDLEWGDQEIDVPEPGEGDSVNESEVVTDIEKCTSDVSTSADLPGTNVRRHRVQPTWMRDYVIGEGLSEDENEACLVLSTADDPVTIPIYKASRTEADLLSHSNRTPIFLPLNCEADASRGGDAVIADRPHEPPSSPPATSVLSGVRRWFDEAGKVELVHCDSQDQVAYVMTKPLKVDQFCKLRKSMGVCAEAGQVFAFVEVRPQALEVIRSGVQVFVFVEVGPQALEVIRSGVGPKALEVIRSEVIRREVGPQALEVIRSEVEPQALEVIRSEVGPKALEVIRSEVGPQTLDIIRREVGPQALEVIRNEVGPQALGLIRREAGPQALEVIRSEVGPQALELIRSGVQVFAFVEVRPQALESSSRGAQVDKILSRCSSYGVRVKEPIVESSIRRARPVAQDEKLKGRSSR
nr:Retrovirus-related Pol polyprotein from transposon TNT 1-94 [Ipomoea batatas]